MQPDAASHANPKATGTWTLLDSDREIAVESGWEGLEAVLSNPSRRTEPKNTIVTLVAPSGETLQVGVAGPGDGDNPDLRDPLAMIESIGASGDPPYLVVVGDPSMTFEKDGVVVFRFGGEWTEILRRHCVPVDVMLKVVNHFFLTGTLADWVTWEQV